MKENNRAILQAGNLFVFTMNDPVNFIDPSGRVAVWVASAAIGGTIGFIVGGLAGGAVAFISGDDVLSAMASGAIGGAAGGFVAGAITGYFIDPVATSIGKAILIGMGAGAAGGTTESLLTQSLDHLFTHGTSTRVEISGADVLLSAFSGAAFAGAGAGISQMNFLPHMLQFNSVDDLILNAHIIGGFFSMSSYAPDLALSMLQNMMEQMNLDPIIYFPTTPQSSVSFGCIIAPYSFSNAIERGRNR